MGYKDNTVIKIMKSFPHFNFQYRKFIIAKFPKNYNNKETEM